MQSNHTNLQPTPQQHHQLLTDTSDDDFEQFLQSRNHTNARSSNNNNGHHGDDIARLHDGGKTLIFSGAKDPERNNRTRLAQGGSGSSSIGGGHISENGSGLPRMMASRKTGASTRNNNRNGTAALSQQTSSSSSSKRGMGDAGGYFGASASSWSDWSTNLTSLTSSGGNSKKMEILQMNLPEDMRISKLLRRLANEKNLNAALDLCEKLQITVADPTNVAYIRRSFDLLAEAVTSLLRDGPPECADALARIFGQLGYVMRGTFVAYKVWMIKCYKAEPLRVAMMRALLKTLQLDVAARKGELMDHAPGMMDMLKVYLEDAEAVPLFMAITETIRQFSVAYPMAFEPHFTDIVDIVVGWHLETEQSVELKQHCGKILQGFDRFWAMDANFTVNLLGQFLEDIVSCGEEILMNMNALEDKSNRRSPILDGNAAPEQCFVALVGAFTSVLKCAPQSLPNHIGWNLLTDSFHKITKFAEAAIAQSDDPELLVNINEFIIIVLEFRPVDVELPFGYVRLQLAQLADYSDKQILSTLFVILRLVDVTPEDDIATLIEDLFNFGSSLPLLRFSKNRQVRSAVIRIYTQVLNIKNVSVLQTVYHYILVDLGRALNAMTIIKPEQWSVALDIKSKRQYTECQAETTVTFYLTTLSVLASSTSSIIAMWALQPSIIELLTLELNAHSFRTWRNFPAVHFAAITLLTAHCKKNNNFIASSDLLNAASTRISEGFNKMSFGSSAASPTTQHFAIIIKFMCKLLENLLVHMPSASEQTIHTVLDWIHTLFTQISGYAQILEHDQIFTNIALSLCRLTVQTQNPRILLRATRCLDALQQFSVVNETVLVRFAEICCIHMCSTSESTRNRFSAIFSKLPLAIALRQVSDESGLAKERSTRVNRLLHWFGSSTDAKPTIRPKAFLRLIEVMQVNPSTANYFRPASFEMCWPAVTTPTNGVSGDLDEASDFGHFTCNDLRCLVQWVQWSAAQLCVDTKLRTPLGKPIDTFVGFERLIKGFARSFVLGDTKISSAEVLLANQHNVRVLLGFIEALEKIIYNASDGTAFAMPPPERPSRMFFGVNTSTCKEYFNRNRMTVNLLAMNGLDADIVVRNSEITLRDLVDGGKSKDEEFVFALVNMVGALLRNGESEALQGLYVWCKQTVGRKFEWVQHAADQASGRREAALAGYRHYLGTDEGKAGHVLIREFVADQVILCLDLMHDWYQMSECVRIVESDQQLNKRTHLPTIYKSSSQLDATIKYLSESNTDPLVELGDWNVLAASDDGTAMTDIPSDLMSYQKIISVVENTLIEAFVDETRFNAEKLRLCKLITSKCLQECLRTGSQEQLHNLTILSHMCHKVDNPNREPGAILSLKVDPSVGSSSLSRVLGWCDLLASGHGFKPQLSANDRRTINDLHLDVCSLARKEANYSVCQLMLDRYFQDVVQRPWPIIENNFVYSYDQTAVNDVANSAIILDGTTARALYEGAKLLHKTKPNDYACQYAATLVVGVALRVAEHEMEQVREDQGPLRTIAARTLLTLSEWMQGEPDQFLTKDLKLPLTRLVSSLPDVRPQHTVANNSTSTEIPIIDAAVGKLIQFSVNQCPNLSKTWGALGNWCFRWGRKMVEVRVKNGDNRIGPNDIEAIRRLLPDTDEETIVKVVAILNGHQVSADDEEIAVSDAASCSTEAIEAQLRTVATLVDIDLDVLHALLDIWRQAQQNVYAYYRMSADAYFKYLHLTSGDGETNDEDNATGPTGCSKVTVTLRLLRLIVKHALGLQDVLEEGLAKTPTSPWKIIIPQLFSRLNHHEPYVRKRVSELLCRLAVDSPNLIIFPAVVGSNQEQRMDLADISMVSADDEIEDDGRNTSTDTTLTCSFNSLLDILSNQAPETVSQVQCLVRELKRVTLLWDELWLVGLAQTYSDTSKRLTKFDSDVRRWKFESDDPDSSLLAERYRIMLRPLIFVVERLQAMTCVKAETNNERSFQRHFTRLIDDTLTALRQPFHIEHYAENINKFKSFYGLLQSRSRARAYQAMKMLDISPVLAQMNNTAIAMPGVVSTASPIYIKTVNNSVRILPTKTKPKKLAFHGSDGRRYTYLFKGLEDLHLDERIMQFLSIANSMMNKSSARSSNVRYRARNYSVIPLGSRSGLISWVDGLMPIFALYKKWMMRENFQVKKDKASAAVSAKGGETTAPARLWDTYLAKLVPRLAEHKCKVSDNRRDWPLEATRKVLEDLMAETPRDLLSKEIWCNSVNSAAWRQSVRNFSHSVAVMSVIGYVIGLGDRHLDNILIDIGSGEVVHIDYNVCFEKGKTLRVPEKVPFRMTQNVEDALGVTGVEGTFRITCENVLSTLKNGRETLLTLLEAFVYDPLIDWAVGDDGAGALAVAAYGGEALGGELRQAHKQLEHEVTRDTLALRFTEIRPDWMRNSVDVRDQLTQMQRLLRLMQTQREEKLAIEKRRDLMFKQLAIVGEVQQFGSAMQCHPINTVSQRYAVLKRARGEHERIQQLMQTKAHENREHMKRYVDCVREATKANARAELLLAINQVKSALNVSEFEIVRQLLESSDQQAMYVQGDQIRKELDTSYMQQAVVLKQCIEAIIQYSEVASLHSTSQANGRHRHIRYAEWCEALVQFPSVMMCIEVNLQFKAEFTEAAPKPPLEMVVQNICQLITAYDADKKKVHKLCERLQSEMESSEAAKEMDGTMARYLQDRTRDGSVVKTLCDFNRRMLMLEGAAEAAGDSLLDMTTSNGKWFLDEICAMSAMSLRLCELAHSAAAPDQPNTNVMHSLNVAHSSYVTLRKFTGTFIRTVLTGTMVELFAENPTVLAMISAVSQIAQQLPTSETMMANLRLHLRCSIMEMPSPHDSTLRDVQTLKMRLGNLRQTFADEPETAGSKLFSDFWTMFDALDTDHRRLTEAVDALDIPNEWQRIDQIKESRNLATFTFNKKTRTIIEDIAMISRFFTIYKTFETCVRQAYQKGVQNDVEQAHGVFDTDVLVRPVRQFVAEYVRQNRLGVVPSMVALFVCNRLQSLGLNISDEMDRADFGAHQKTALDELCRSVVDKALADGVCTMQSLNRDAQMFAQFDVSRRRAESFEQLLEAIQSQQELCQLAQRALSANMWLHEEQLANDQGLLEQSPVNRSALVDQMANANKTLMAWRTTITKMRSETANFVTAINQRLKWAVGANPQLNDVLSTFTATVQMKQNQYDQADHLANVIIANCSAILSFERLRITGEATHEADRQFFGLVASCEKSCMMIRSCGDMVSPVEEALVELLDPEGPVDHAWLSSVSEIVNEMCQQQHENLLANERAIVGTEDQLHECAQHLRVRMASHHRMATEVKSLLRKLLKVNGAHAASVKDYFRVHKEFLDAVSELHGHVLSKDFTEDVVEETLNQLETVLDNLSLVYGGLLFVEVEFRQPGHPAANSQELRPDPIVSPVKKQPNGSKAREKCNAYAMSVWRRIRMKLEGRDPDPTRRFTVAEQVDWMIREARNPDNLAVLYEGWAPWV